MKAEDDPFDLEKFRLRPEDLQGYAGTAAAPRARGRRRDQFIIVPKSWSDQLKSRLRTTCSTNTGRRAGGRSR
jgi:hypothetical protein